MKKVATESATKHAQTVQQLDETLKPSSELIKHFRQYAREKPEVVALWCLGIGFVLGWKLKLW